MGPPASTCHLHHLEAQVHTIPLHTYTLVAQLLAALRVPWCTLRAAPRQVPLCPPPPSLSGPVAQPLVLPAIDALVPTLQPNVPASVPSPITQPPHSIPPDVPSAPHVPRLYAGQNYLDCAILAHPDTPLGASQFLEGSLVAWAEGKAPADRRSGPPAPGSLTSLFT